MEKDFSCQGCLGQHFWVRQPTGTNPGWYICCLECQRLYQLLPQGQVEEINYAN